MYSELYETWKRELESALVEKLSDDFYLRVADYLTRLKEESRMLDNRTVKARLLKTEIKHAKRMLRGLLQVRYSKLIKLTAKGEKDPLNVLTNEEERIFTGASPFIESYQAFVKNLLRGHLVNVGVEKERRTDVLRFLNDVPAIIGSDMKTYGPFKVEDVASLPVDNAKILVKQGLAEKVETT
jgi:DNA replication factor GINS